MIVPPREPDTGEGCRKYVTGDKKKVRVPKEGPKRTSKGRSLKKKGNFCAAPFAPHRAPSIPKSGHRPPKEGEGGWGGCRKERSTNGPLWHLLTLAVGCRRREGAGTAIGVSQTDHVGVRQCPDRRICHPSCRQLHRERPQRRRCEPHPCQPHLKHATAP